MGESLVVWNVAEDFMQKLRKLSFSQTKNVAILMKTDKDKCLELLHEAFKDISPDGFKDDPPEGQTHFIVHRSTYQQDDGRASYPLCFIFPIPIGFKPKQQMMHAGSKNKLVPTAEVTKVLETRKTKKT